MFEDIEGPPQVTMVRVLLVLAIAIPILIEVITFGGLLGHYLGGGGDPAATGTPTPGDDGAGAGATILPETAATERVESASLITGEDNWQFIFTVAVEGPAEPYELRLRAVRTREGTTVAGSGATTGGVPAGGSGTVTGTWLLPPGEHPESLSVEVVTTPEGGTEEVREYTVTIGNVPVSSG
jgi:hypothetical protein